MADAAEPDVEGGGALRERNKGLSESAARGDGDGSKKIDSGKLKIKPVFAQNCLKIFKEAHQSKEIKKQYFRWSIINYSK